MISGTGYGRALETVPAHSARVSRIRSILRSLVGGRPVPEGKRRAPDADTYDRRVVRSRRELDHIGDARLSKEQR